MKTTRKLLLLISIILFLLILTLTVLAAFYDNYLIIKNCGTSQILAILVGVDVVFASLYLFLSSNKKSVFTIASTILLVLTEIIMLTITFSPKYYYTTHTSADGNIAFIVEEKILPNKTSVTFYQKTSDIFYKRKYATSLTEKNMQNYTLGDYTLTFDEKYIRINIPSSNKTQILLKH